jgi:ADP-ribose pyrophosphatase
MQHKKWKIIGRKDVSPSKWFPITKDEVKIPSGKKIDYFKTELANVAMMVAITKDKELVFVRQYKHGIGEVCLEFPAGRIENNRTAKQTAVIELKEETGIEINESQLVKIAELWTEPSKSTVRVTGFLVTDVEITGEQDLEETEQIEVVKVPMSKVSDLLMSGELHASDTLALLLLVKTKYPKIFI